ncbi:MAG: mechanosensitive ion channel family protein [Thermanaeromonas sp.]|uniref:mechanosensitive ion channel family protein n=1 Tax=Thermanaeromonas sp. TaxID=2003697 RepID=UPI002438B826|nr:mechanosensitive ion channel family protein [Thermanaeromonas sp.]MCG0278698.1 mechanosensitive ion channel family protein [Thermanaeromonas sp.]
MNWPAFPWEAVEEKILFLMPRLPLMLAILIAVLIAQRLIFQLIHRFFDMAKVEPYKKQTLRSLFLSAARYSLYALAALVILPVLGVNVTAIVAGVSLVGLAVGFGAQALVRDIITGLFIVFEDQLRVGDLVQINEKVTGTVEEVGLRTTTLREWSGTKFYIANSEIKTVRNYNREELRASVNVIFPFDEDPHRVREMLEEVCKEVEKEYRDDFLPGPGGLAEPPQVYGVTDMDKSGRGVQFTVTAKTRPASVWRIERVLRERIWQACKERGIRIC